MLVVFSKLFLQVRPFSITKAVEPEFKFQAAVPTSRSFWLRLQNDLVH